MLLHCELQKTNDCMIPSPMQVKMDNSLRQTGAGGQTLHHRPPPRNAPPYHHYASPYRSSLHLNTRSVSPRVTEGGWQLCLHLTESPTFSLQHLICLKYWTPPIQGTITHRDYNKKRSHSSQYAAELDNVLCNEPGEEASVKNWARP